MVKAASASGPSERGLMVEQLRLLRKLNGHKTPGVPVIVAHRLALSPDARREQTNHRYFNFKRLGRNVDIKCYYKCRSFVSCDQS